MLKVIQKFFAFCDKKNRKKFRLSIFLDVLQACFEGMKIPAIAVMIGAIVNGNVDNKSIWASLMIMLVSVIGSGALKAKGTML